MITSSLCFRVSLSVSHRWTEPLGVSEQHGSSRASVHQWQQHTAQRRSAAVHPRLQRPSSVRPAVREGEEKHDVIRRAEAVMCLDGGGCLVHTVGISYVRLILMRLKGT